jgi:hypothetical protein
LPRYFVSLAVEKSDRTVLAQILLRLRYVQLDRASLSVGQTAEPSTSAT